MTQQALVIRPDQTLSTTELTARDLLNRGRTSHFYWLTDKGREAFQLLFGEEAVESEYHRLKACHKSPEHIALNLQARDVFVARGAIVDLYPRPVQTAPGIGGEEEIYHAPGLIVVFPAEGRPLYVECERGTSRKQDKK
jgi:hypothetical protein